MDHGSNGGRTVVGSSGPPFRERQSRWFTYVPLAIALLSLALGSVVLLAMAPSLLPNPLGTELSPAFIAIGALSLISIGLLVFIVLAYVSQLRRTKEALRGLEAQFLQAQKMEAVGQLAGGVAHDFNNLLTAILGYSALVRDGMTDVVRRRNVDEVIKAATRATSLTKQLLAFSRREEPAVVALNANDVVEDLLDMLRRLMGEHIVVTTALAHDLESIRSDRGQLEQVIVNLILNARDAMPGGGLIRIETANVRIDSESFAQGGRIARGHYVMLAIHDSGVGISDAVRAKLFQPFFTTKDRGKGTGLGLATVFGIVSASQGYIAVESNVGKGSVFRVYWPRIVDPTRKRPPWTAEPASPPSPAPRSSILIVEDEEAVRYLSRAILERAGYRVFEATTPDQAESMLSEVGPVDVLIADVMLPGGRGPELFNRLRPRYPALRVVFMSGYLDEAIPEQSPVNPAMRFLQKPFVAEALLSKVENLLATANAGR